MNYAPVNQYIRTFDELLASVSTEECPQVHLIDIENLVCAGYFDVFAVRRIRHLYLTASGAGKSDLFLIASGPQNREAIYEGWPGAAYMWRKGQDGADILLQEVFANLEKPENFQRLFIGSGDGRLASVADTAVKAGLPVTVIAIKAHLSRLFRFHHTVELENISNLRPPASNVSSKPAEVLTHV